MADATAFPFTGAVPVALYVLVVSDAGSDVGLFFIAAPPLVAFQSGCTLTCAPAAIPDSFVFSAVV